MPLKSPTKNTRPTPHHFLIFSISQGMFIPATGYNAKMMHSADCINILETYNIATNLTPPITTMRKITINI